MSVSSELLRHVFIRKLFAFAGKSLLVYDYILTFSLEIAYIWNAPSSFVKMFFLINRYGNLIGQTFVLLEETGYWNHGTQRSCVAFAQFYVFFVYFSGESIRLLVLMRTCAILGCRRHIAVSWAMLYTTYATAILVVSVFPAWSGNPVEFEHVTEIDICFARVGSGNWLVWLIPLFLDGLMLGFAVCSLYRLIKWSPGRSPSQLIRLLVRDAVVFYFAALFNVLSTIICWTVYSQDPRDFIAALITYPILSVVGQRLILNLRRQRANPNSTRDLNEQIDRQIANMHALEQIESSISSELSELGFTYGQETV